MIPRRRTFSGKFFNPYQKNVPRGFIDFLLWQMGFYNDPEAPRPIPPGFVYPNPKEKISEKDPGVLWVNHSTFLIEIDDSTFLVDPIWNDRCSPSRFFGPKRVCPPLPPIDNLPPIDYVLISHDHYDHLDLESISTLHGLFPKIIWIVPLGVRSWFLHHLPGIGKESILEIDWWESLTLNSAKITSVPAQHFSGRGFWDRNRSLWSGYVVEMNNSRKKFYFAGDTGYNEYDFKEIGRRLGPMDLSLIPIGVYLPRKFMKPVHVNPQEAVTIHAEVRSKLSVGSHFGTFHLSHEPLEQPPYDLFCAMQEAQLPLGEFRVLEPGQRIAW